ncbi:hypothetical protein K501DRAFT_171593, partial [Backusella circina FSU 941]
VKDMRPMLKNAECEVIVLQQGEPTSTRDGDTIHHFLVADKTASIILNVWGIPGQYIKGGDILHIIGGSCKLRKGQLCLSAFHSSKIRRIGQDTFPFVEKPNLSEVDYNQVTNTPNWPNNNNTNNSNNNIGNLRAPQQDQDQQSSQQKNSARSHNRGYPYRGGGRPSRDGRGQNKSRYHRDLDSVM